MQERVDAQPQRSTLLVRHLGQRDLEADDARLEPANAGLDSEAQLFATARIVEGARGEIGQPEADQRALQLAQLRIPRAPSPARVEQFFQVVADADADSVHRGA